MSDIVNAMLGGRIEEFTSVSAVPVPAAVPLSRPQRPKTKRRPPPNSPNRRAGLAYAMLGEDAEDDSEVEQQGDSNVIPDDAQRVDPDHPDDEKDNDANRFRGAEPEIPEPLIEPSAALVAPNTTPRAMEPLDSSQIPAPPSTLSTLGVRTESVVPPAPPPPQNVNIPDAGRILESLMASAGSGMPAPSGDGNAVLARGVGMPDPTPERTFSAEDPRLALAMRFR